jgi:hypothetical protein
VNEDNLNGCAHDRCWANCLRYNRFRWKGNGNLGEEFSGWGDNRVTEQRQGLHRLEKLGLKALKNLSSWFWRIKLIDYSICRNVLKYNIEMLAKVRLIELRSTVVKNPASHWGRTRLKYQPRYRLSCLKFLVVFISPSVPFIRPPLFLSLSFSIHHSLPLFSSTQHILNNWKRRR